MSAQKEQEEGSRAVRTDKNRKAVYGMEKRKEGIKLKKKKQVRLTGKKLFLPILLFHCNINTIIVILFIFLSPLFISLLTLTTTLLYKCNFSMNV